MIFSIIVPIYNAENSIERCIKSVLNQTYGKWELCLVIDGSTDKSYEICNEFAQRDKRIRVISKKNGGVSSARNQGLKYAHGEYVCFLDSDDMYKTDFLLKFFNELSVYPYDLVSSGFILRDSESLSCTKYAFDDIFYSHDELKMYLMSAKQSYMFGIPWNKCYKRSIIETYGLSFDEGINSYEDELFVTTYLQHCNNVRTISALTYDYVASSSNSLSKKYIDFKVRKNTASLIYITARKLSQDRDYQDYCKKAYFQHFLLAIEELYYKHNYRNNNIYVRRIIINEVINDALHQPDSSYFLDVLKSRHLMPIFWQIEIVYQFRRIKSLIVELLKNL